MVKVTAEQVTATKANINVGMRAIGLTISLLFSNFFHGLILLSILKFCNVSRLADVLRYVIRVRLTVTHRENYREKPRFQHVNAARTGRVASDDDQ
jgi:hypothetical protein